MDSKSVDIKSMTLQELKDEFKRQGLPAFRATQVYQWMHVKLAAGFEEMTNLSKEQRRELAQKYDYVCLQPVRIQESQIDGTKKFLFELSDGNYVESVFMRYRHGNSVCISSQVGCKMGCKFCASTLDGWERNLLASEMLDQIYAITRSVGERISNVVVMGTGEPLDNFDNLVRFIRLLTNEDGLHISQRNITVSTCGIIPGIWKFAEDAPQVNLAVSLHAPNQELRQKTMPVARKYGYDELMKACREYTERTGRRITFEYALIDGVNDTKECAEELAARLRGWLAHVNLIPLNEVSGREYRKAQAENVRRFREILERQHVAVTVRRTLGSDIDAACGQLRRNRD